MRKRGSSSKVDEQFCEFKDKVGVGKENLNGNDNPDNGNTDVNSWSLSLSPVRGGGEE
jgi:hypothetical protein